MCVFFHFLFDFFAVIFGEWCIVRIHWQKKQLSDKHRFDFVGGSLIYDEYDVFVVCVCVYEEMFLFCRLIGQRLLHTIHSLRFQHVVLILQHRFSAILINPAIGRDEEKQNHDILEWKWCTFDFEI